MSYIGISIPELFSNNRVIPAIIFSETFLLPPGNKGKAPIINSEKIIL
jgi:hypothetical protein